MQGCRLRIGLMMAVIGCLLLTPAGVWAQQPKPGGTLRVAWEADVTGLDPHLSTGVQAYRVLGNLFNSLITIDTALNYVPDLAESWEILEGGKVYVFHLRKGVKFIDGTDFDAEVVRWNYQRIMDPDEKTFVAPFFAIVDRVEALDAHAVKFTLKYPSMTLLPVIAAERVGFLQMSPAVFKQWAGRRSGCIPWAPARLSWRDGTKIKSSCWRKILSISSQGSPTWIASSCGS
jgi:peptide/nickel transport system substrate-binding protein